MSADPQGMGGDLPEFGAEARELAAALLARVPPDHPLVQVEIPAAILGAPSLTPQEESAGITQQDIYGILARSRACLRVMRDDIERKRGAQPVGIEVIAERVSIAITARLIIERFVARAIERGLATGGLP